MDQSLHSKQRAFAASLVFLIGGTCACSAASYCEYQRLMQAHETLVFCGQEIAPESEARYIKLMKEIESYLPFLSKKTDSEPARDSIRIRKHLAQEGKDRICKDPALSLSREDFFQYVSDAGMARVRNLMSKPRNPREGDCY